MTPRTKQYLILREQGLTYRDIAARLGVSYQAVAQVCAKQGDAQFRKIKPDGCVYPVLRNWMNENRVSRQELYRRMHDGEPCIGKAPYVIRDRLTGRSLWRMDEIDRLLDVTGMTYEELFRRETA
jgi:hypothetical protein